MHDKFISLLSIISLFGVLFMINFTTPPEVGVLGVLVFFTMIFIILFFIMLNVIRVFQKILSEKKDRGVISTNKTYLYALVLSFAPLMLLVIRPSASINVFTVSLVAVFVVLGCFFVHKRA